MTRQKVFVTIGIIVVAAAVVAANLWFASGSALAVTTETANEIAKKYIQPSHLVWIVVGDMAKVEPGIRELNIGEVHKIDADGNPVQ